MPSVFGLFAAQQSPIIVKIVEPQEDKYGISRVIVQAIGFTGAVTLLAVLLGIAMGGLLFWIRRRQSE